MSQTESVRLRFYKTGSYRVWPSRHRDKSILVLHLKGLEDAGAVMLALDLFELLEASPAEIEAGRVREGEVGEESSQALMMALKK